MIVEIDIAAADDIEQHGWLDRILYKIEDEWHVWKVDALDEGAFATTSFVAQQGIRGTRVMELFRASAKRAAYPLKPHRRRVRVTLHQQRDGELPPEQAARLAEEKLVVLVENRESDGAFLKRVLHVLDRPLLAVVDRSAKIDSVGGKGQMETEVRRVTQGPIRPRYVVVVDSDRRGPHDSPSTEAQRLAHTCSELGVPCWVLAKREAENYLPTCLLRARRNVSREYLARVETWNGLDDDQRDFFDMKDGLGDEPTPSEEELFEDLAEDQREILRHGFGEKVGDCWTDWGTRLTARELRERDRGDLVVGVQLLSSEV